MKYLKLIFIYNIFLLVLLCGCTQSKKLPAKTNEPTEEPFQTANPTLKEQRAKTSVGIWYSVWYTNGTGAGNDNFWNAENILYKPLLPDKTFGRYDSLDDEIIQYHLNEITGAQIDFIIMDQTNDIDVGGGFINQRSIKMAKSIMKWNQDSNNRPIKYCSAVGVFAAINKDLSIIETEAKKLWERYVEKPWGTEEHHLYVDGKPLMVIFETTKEQWEAYTGDKTYSDKFTFRYAVGHARKSEYWGWVMPEGTLVSEDVAVIMPGWYKFNWPVEKVYRNKGAWYKSAWETLLKSEIIPDHVVINSFNEYAEHTAVFTADTSDFPDDYPIEKWMDKDGNLSPSMYWDMTKEYIKKYKDGHTE